MSEHPGGAHGQRQREHPENREQPQKREQPEKREHPDEREQPENGRSRWIALYVLCAGMLMIVLDSMCRS